MLRDLVKKRKKDCKRERKKDLIIKKKEFIKKRKTAGRGKGGPRGE